MVRTKILTGKRTGKVPKVLPQRNPRTGRFLTGNPVKALSGERGAILGNKKRRS